MMARRIKLSTFSISFAEDPPIRTSAALIKMVVSAPAQGGFTPATMRQAIKIIDAVENASDAYLMLEDDDYGFLKAKLDVFPWRVPDKGLLAFIESIENASKVDLNPALGKPAVEYPRPLPG